MGRPRKGHVDGLLAWNNFLRRGYSIGPRVSHSGILCAGAGSYKACASHEELASLAHGLCDPEGRQTARLRSFQRDGASAAALQQPRGSNGGVRVQKTLPCRAYGWAGLTGESHAPKCKGGGLLSSRNHCARMAWVCVACLPERPMAVCKVSALTLLLSVCQH